MRKVINIQVTVLFISVIFSGIVLAQVPQLINYQAFLTDATGNPITGDRAIQFKIYNETSGGTEIWSETQSVTVTDGLFSVLLGSKTTIPYSVFDGSDKYLSLKIGTDAEMTPRKRLVSVGYAFKANAASSVNGASNIFPSSGSVGIGTTSPGSHLEVVNGMMISGTGSEGGQLTLLDGDRQGGWEIDNFGDSGKEELRFFRDRGYNDTWGLVINTSGDVGVGGVLQASGMVISQSGGFKFPDGTVQTTAMTGSELALPYSKTVASSDPAFSITNTGEGYSIFGISQYIGKSGIYGKGCIGVRGECTFWGVGSGVRGEADDASTYGIHGINKKGYAGYFSVAVRVTGMLEKPGGGFMIDHPLDPAHKYLYHSFVESPDMKNVYDGVIILDNHGEGSVQLPAWFEALNKDFRYQLTCIGGFAPVYIAEEITNNQFKIAGGKAGLKVSWQVTGIRKDAWANAHRIPVEEEKEGYETGRYLHPQENGVLERLGIDYEERKTMSQEQERIENTSIRIKELNSKR